MSLNVFVRANFYGLDGKAELIIAIDEKHEHVLESTSIVSEMDRLCTRCEQIRVQLGLPVR